MQLLFILLKYVGVCRKSISYAMLVMELLDPVLVKCFPFLSRHLPAASNIGRFSSQS